MRCVERVRYWFWRAVGTRGHLPQCRARTMVAVDRHGDGLVSGWCCAPGCPAEARKRERSRG